MHGQGLVEQLLDGEDERGLLRPDHLEKSFFIAERNSGKERRKDGTSTSEKFDVESEPFISREGGREGEE